MIEVRFHGRGGQGSVTAAELMAQAAIAEGKHAQAFPSFGPERRGAPVTAFLRISESPISLREKIESPDIIVILDPSLIELVDVFHGLKEGGIIVINCPAEYARTLSERTKHYRMINVDATRIAQETIGLPIANTAIIGALIKGLDLLDVHSLETPLQNRFGRLAEKNMQALIKAHEAAEISEASSGLGPAKTEPGEPYSDHIRREALMGWRDLELGGDIVEFGNSRQFLTGSWRMAGRPAIHEEKCNQCGLCWIFCPEDALEQSTEGHFLCNLDYCKGCGICVQECPKGAIEMEEEA